MRKINIFISFFFIIFSIQAQESSLSLQGIFDLTVPSAGSDGKAIHLVAMVDIADISIFGIGVANNGGGTDGQEETLPVMSVSAGDDILLARTPEAMSSYLADCYTEFEHVLVAGTDISQNGDDAIELFENGVVIETFGDIDTDGSGESWEYMDSWAYKVDGEWTYGGVNCSDGSETTLSSSCIYPMCDTGEELSGCTDSTAFNYNMNATIDDGSCVAISEGCMISSAANYDETANTSCESCCDFNGCMDTDALNFDSDATLDDGSCLYDNASLTNGLSLQGIFDLTVPSAGSDGKAIHLVAMVDIADISIFGIGVANNGGGTDGQEETLPVMSVSAGDDILLARTPEAMSSYLADCYTEFEHVLVAGTDISQNGDDAIELFENGVVIETFGDIDTDGSGESWEYMDSWAYKVDGEWTYGGVNCSDGSETTLSSSCIYPMCDTGEELSGCTDSTAFNYNMNATIDDGSCVAISEGCMDDVACNYNIDANIDDESCVYPELYYDCDSTCLMDLDGDMICDQLDNCPEISNTDQIDTNADGDGDVCDYDDGLDIDSIESGSFKLLRMYDVLGKTYSVHPEGKVLFYLYDNGKVIGKLK